MGSSGDILVGSVECPALNRRPAEPRPSGASNSATPVSFGGGRDARAPRQARCPRTQAGQMPALPGRRDARAPRRARCPRTQAGETPAHPGRRNARAPRRAGPPRTRRIMSQPSTTRFSLLQSQIEPGALLRRQTHLQRNQVGGEFLRCAAPYQRIDIEWLAQHIRQGDLRDA